MTSGMNSTKIHPQKIYLKEGMLVKTAAAYIRVSTNMQEELSPDAQKRLIAEYAHKNNILLSNEYIFIENGISGRTADKRPEFQRMIAAAKQKPKPFDMILLWKFSRFARNQDEAAFYKGMLRKKCGVDVVSITEPIIEGMYGRLIEMIIEWNDEFYSYNLSQEVLKGMTEKALRGGYQSKPPLGYRIETPKQPPVIVLEEAQTVRMIFDKYVNENMDTFQIARHLNSLGLRTSRGNPFERRSVEYILQNPMYIGTVRWNRVHNAAKKLKAPDEWILTDGLHEPIIDKDTFEKARERLCREYVPPNAKPAAVRKHWLSGMLKCSACGRSLSSSRRTDKSGKHTYYNFQCCGYLKGKCLESHNISAKKMEAFILEILEKDLSGSGIQYEILKSAKERCELPLLKDQLAKLSIKEQRIRDAYLNGIDTMDEYKINKETLKEERAQIKQRIQELQGVPGTKTMEPPMCRRVSRVYEMLLSEEGTAEAKNKAMQAIVQKFVYHKGTGMVDIYYYYS